MNQFFTFSGRSTRGGPESFRGGTLSVSLKFLLLTLLVFVSLGNTVRAQVTGYTFGSAAGTYSPNVGGTTILAAGADDVSSAPTAIGFNFTFGGSVFTGFVANSNGHIRFGSLPPSSPYFPISTTGNTFAIAGLGRDGRTGGAVTTRLTGTAPNRVLTIEYPTFNLTYLSVANTQSFQIKLYETTNVVQLVYGPTAGTTTYTGQVGLRGAAVASDVNNRTTTTNWAATTAGTQLSTMTWSGAVKPASGLTYTWTPPGPCTGTPSPGAAGTTAALVCGGNTATLSIPVVSGSGITYQWQSGPTAAGPWSNITGATSNSTLQTITATAYYRCNVTCTASGLSAASSSILVTQDNTCYCASAASSNADSEILNVTIGALNNTSNCATVAPGAGSILNRYSNFRTGPLSAVAQPVFKGVSIPFSVSASACGTSLYDRIFKIFIDGNQDGDYLDAGEEVFTSPLLPSTATSGINTAGYTPTTGNLTIPNTFLNGNTGMRIILAETVNPALITSCYNGYTWGETEDYVINLSPPTPCTTTPPASTTNSSAANVCPGVNFTLSLATTYLQTGYTFQWQSGPSNTGPWTDISGATSTTRVQNQSAATWYRCRVNCPFGGVETTSTPAQVSMSSVFNCYCTSSATNIGDGDISNVTVATLNNTSTCTPGLPAPSITQRYSNYTASVPAVNIARSAVVPLSVAIAHCSGSAFTNNVAIYIDFNQDGDLTDAGEQVYAGGPSTLLNQTLPASTFIVPCDAVLGNTLMRVVMVDDFIGEVPSPCGTYGYGETEDYRVNITNALACSGTPPSSNATSSAASVCPSTTFALGLSAAYASCDYSFQWQRSTDNVTFTAISGATSPSQSITGQTSATYYRCVITCTVSGLDETSVSILVNQNTLLSCYCPSAAVLTGWGDITGVTVGTINNTSTCASVGPGAGSVNSLYANYAATQTDLVKTENNAMSVTINNCTNGTYSYVTKVWIDYNRDGDLLDAGELIYTSPIVSLGSSAQTLAFNFTVPTAAQSGVTLMRIVTHETSVAGDVQPCGSLSGGNFYGETEDYTINIITPPACSGTPTPGTLSSSLQLLNNTFTVLNPVGLGIELNNAYQWEESDDNGGADPWAPAVGGSGATSNVYTTPNLLGTRWYRLNVECTTSGLSATTNAIQITTVGGTSCADPYVVGGLPFTLNFSTNGAGDDIGVQTSACSNLYGGGSDVVFEFTAPAAGNYEISVVNTSNTRNIGWFLKDGTNCATTSSSLACAVSTASYNSAHNIVAIPAAGTYYVVVDHVVPTSQSNFFIRIRQTPAAPGNDNCATAQVVTQGASSTCTAPVAGTLAGGTASGVPLICTGSLINADDDVWYSFTATAEAAFVDVVPATNGVVESGANIAWELFSGNCTGLTPLFCRNASTSRGTDENATVTGLTIGVTYYLRIYDRDAGYGSAGGNFSLCIYTPAPPSNNDCAGATVLAVGGVCTTTSGVTVAATQSLAAVACNGFTGNADDDVWYTFTLAAATNVNIQVEATNTLFDPVVQLFSGSCGSPTSITCADNSLRGGVENLTRALSAGTYFVRVYHYGLGSGGGGAHTICVTNSFPAIAPVNDNVCGAISLAINQTCSPDGPFQSLTATRTLGLSVAQQGDGNPNDDVWFKFNTVGNTSVTIGVQGGGGYDAVFQLYSATDCKNSVNPIVTPADFVAANGFEEQTIFGLAINTTYYIRVFDWNTAPPTGEFTICVSETPRPANDNLPSAEFIYVQNSATCTNPVFGFTVNATPADAVAPASCGGNADDNVWYRFVATNTTATISVTGTQGFDPTVDLRSGLGSITCVNATGANGTETINATGLTVGTSYWVQVFGGATNPSGWGTFEICVFGTALPPVNDLCSGALALPNTSPCTPVAGILTAATVSQAPCAGSGAFDVWYSFIASNPTATITPVGAEGFTDMVVQIFSGSCAALTSVGCANSNPAPGTENLVVAGLTPGQTYYTRVYANSATAAGTGGLGSPDPNFTICFTGVPPANDNICGATNVTVSSNKVDIVSNNLGATSTEAGVSPAPFLSWNNGVWFKCAVPSNGVVAVCVTGIGFNDTKIRAYTSSNNTCSGTLTLVASDDDSGPGNSPAALSYGSFIYYSGLTPGNTLFFAVDGFSAANFGQFRLNVNDGWLWTGANGFGYNAAGNWINQMAAETTPNPFSPVTVGGSVNWSSAPGTTIINIPASAGAQPIVNSNASIGGIKFAGSVLTQSKVIVNTGFTLTLNGTTFAGTGRGITGIGAGGRFEGGGRLDIGAQTAGQTVTVNTPIRFRLATTVLGSSSGGSQAAQLQSNGNMIFDNNSSLYSGQGPANSNVIGNITYRRQGQSTAWSYNFWSSPITNGLLSSLASPGNIPNLYQYNTANATGIDYLGTQAGWQPLTPSTGMIAGKGYIATGAGLANFTGLPQENSVSIVAGSGGGGNNFNLIGNPYPAPISANAFLTANASRIAGQAMYIWDDDLSGFPFGPGNTYSPGDFIVISPLGSLTGTGPNSGSPFSGNIASCQGFFVNYLSAGGPNFVFNNSMKTYGTNSEFFDVTTATRIRLRLEDKNGVGSETMVAFLDDATDNVDNSYDAPRMQGNPELSLYTFNGTGEYSIQAWPTLSNERIIDLGTLNTVLGTSSISVNLYENFDPTAIVYLEDVELGLFHNLTQTGSYTFENSGLDGENVRFRLHFRAPIGVSSVMDCSGTESGKILVGNPNASPIAIELKNEFNEVVATAAPFVGEHEFVNLASGNYSLEMSYTDGGIVNRTTAVENNGMTTPASFIASATTVSIADAIIEFQGNAQGATEYTWDFGDGTIVTGDLNPVHAYNALGVYTVTFTAMNNGCGSSATTTITVGADLTGTNNVASASGFSIFPNPAANAANLLLNLDASETSVTVSINDAAGRLVSTKEINDVRSGAVVGLDVDKLANGVYQVTVEGTNFKNVGRLTIAK